MNHEDVAERFVQYCHGKAVKTSGGSGSMRYEGYKLYSYSTVVAMYHPEFNLLAMTSERHNNTTLRHLGHLWRAAVSTSLHMARLEDIHAPESRVNYARFVAVAKTALETAMRARLHTDLYGYNEAMRNAKDYCIHVGREFNPGDFAPRTLLDDKLFTKYVSRRLTGEYQQAGAYA